MSSFAHNISSSTIQFTKRNRLWYSADGNEGKELIQALSGQPRLRKILLGNILLGKDRCGALLIIIKNPESELTVLNLDCSGDQDSGAAFLQRL